MYGITATVPLFSPNKKEQLLWLLLELRFCWWQCCCGRLLWCVFSILMTRVTNFQLDLKCSTLGLRRSLLFSRRSQNVWIQSSSNEHSVLSHWLFLVLLTFTRYHNYVDRTFFYRLSFWHFGGHLFQMKTRDSMEVRWIDSVFIKVKHAARSSISCIYTYIIWII